MSRTVTAQGPRRELLHQPDPASRQTNKPADSTIVAELPRTTIRNGSTVDLVKEKAARTARNARLDAAQRALDGRRLPQADTLVLAARLLLHAADAVTVKLAARWLGVETKDRGEQIEAIAAIIDRPGDPRRVLIALGGAYLETRGTSAAPLPTWDRIGAASAGWLDWLTAIAAYEPGEHDLAETTSWSGA